MSRFAIATLVVSIAVSCGAISACAPAPRLARKVATPLGIAPQGTATADHSRAPLPPARFFQASVEDPFWVTRGDSLDRVVSGGARLELAPTGEVLRGAWERTSSASPEVLQGSLAVSARLGGGFVHFSPHRLFASREFTGGLESIAIAPRGTEIAPGGTATESTIRGLRNGLDRVLVLTDAGTFGIAKGSREAVATRDPGLLDEAALDDHRAARVDVMGRASTTIDGGAHWVDASAAIGVGARSLGVTPTELWIETSSMRYPVEPSGGILAARATPVLGSAGAMRTAFLVPRALEREQSAWGYSDAPPLLTAIAAGARLSDGAAFALTQGVTARVDLTTGKTLAIARSSVSGTMPCHPFEAPDAVLLLCQHERYEGYGSYVMRSSDGRAPVLERAFTDDGVFIADDAGHLGFAGSCRATLRAFDRNDPLRSDEDTSLEPKRIFCVRRAAGEWIEHTFDGPETPLGWAPRGDGRALVVVGAPNAKPPSLSLLGRDDRRIVDRGALRIVRVEAEIEGWAWPKPASLIMRETMGRARSLAYPPLLREITARDDGGLDAWVASTKAEQSFAGVSIDSDGRAAVHDPPPDVAAMVMGGRFGLAIAADGQLFETTDHGRAWSAAGASPVPPASLTGSCSALGCALAGFARVGFGEGHAPIAISVFPAPIPAHGVSLPRLVCAPAGAPAALAPRRATAEHKSTDTSLPTGYGDSIEIHPLEDAPTKKRGSAPLRTHSLGWRIPFDPSGAVVSLNASDIATSVSRFASVTPLLAQGEVELLIVADRKEALVTKSGVALVDAYEQRRFGPATQPSGGVAVGGRALVLADDPRARLLLEHGPSPQRSPIFAGVDHELAGARAFAVATRDDGAIGLLVLDAAGGSAGIARLDPVAASFGAIENIAPWSTLLAASDPRCRPAPEDYRALVLVDTAEWIDLDNTALPGVTFAGRGMALVRFSKQRVCVEAIDASIEDARRSPSQPSTFVARFDAKEPRGAALLGAEVRQPLRCAIASDRARRPGGS